MLHPPRQCLEGNLTSSATLPASEMPHRSCQEHTDPRSTQNSRPPGVGRAESSSASSPFLCWDAAAAAHRSGPAAVLKTPDPHLSGGFQAHPHCRRPPNCACASWQPKAVESSGVKSPGGCVLVVRVLRSIVGKSLGDQIHLTPQASSQRGCGEGPGKSCPPLQLVAQISPPCCCCRHHQLRGPATRQHCSHAHPPHSAPPRSTPQNACRQRLTMHTNTHPIREAGICCDRAGPRGEQRA